MAKAKLKIQKQAGAARPFVIKEGKYRRNFKTLAEAKAYVALQGNAPALRAERETAERTAVIAAYLKPILAAATLLKVRVFPVNVERLTELLDKLGNGFPGDVLDPIHALEILKSGMTGTVEELEILDKVWPGFNGCVSYTLTPTTLTWKWSSKHTGRYATITVPFPTILPMRVEVVRYCDMDDMANHGDECQANENADESWDCNCEGFVEQTVSATVTEWDSNETGEALAAWLERAVDGEVEPVTFPAVEAEP